MVRAFPLLALSLLAVGLLWFGGCGASPEGGANAGGDAEQTDGGDDHSGMNHDGMNNDGMHHDGAQDGQDASAAKIEKGLAELSEADRTLAEKQKMCPVSDQPLGIMGKPLKLEVEGRHVFICCPDCEDAIRKDPEKYFAKLDQ